MYLLQPQLSHSDVLLLVVASVVRAQLHVAVRKAPVLFTTKVNILSVLLNVLKALVTGNIVAMPTDICGKMGNQW